MIQQRINKCYEEDLYYLDLSNLNLNEDDEIFNNKEIIQLLSQVHMLDLSNNHLTKMIDINIYDNIKILNIENNNIDGILNLKYIEELNCSFNNISQINCETLSILIATNNKLTDISHLINLTYIDCSDNPIERIEYMDKLYHLICSTKYISDNYHFEKVEKYKDYYVVQIQK